MTVAETTSLLENAKKELEHISNTDGLLPGQDGEDIKKDITTLLKTLDKVNFSNRAEVLDLFNKLAHGNLLTPLLGDAEEWELIETSLADDGTTIAVLSQNKRFPRVFYNHKTEKAYDIGAIQYKNAAGETFLAKTGRKNITFPYTPSTRYIILE